MTLHFFAACQIIVFSVSSEKQGAGKVNSLISQRNLRRSVFTRIRNDSFWGVLKRVSPWPHLPIGYNPGFTVLPCTITCQVLSEGAICCAEWPQFSNHRLVVVPHIFWNPDTSRSELFINTRFNFSLTQLVVLLTCTDSAKNAWAIASLRAIEK